MELDPSNGLVLFTKFHENDTGQRACVSNSYDNQKMSFFQHLFWGFAGGGGSKDTALEGVKSQRDRFYPSTVILEMF